MSRIGKKPIEIPEKTTVEVDENTITVKGPQGEIKRTFKNGGNITISVTDEGVVVAPENNDLTARMLWGTYFSHIKNMIHGVNEGYEKKLILEGVGYRSAVQGNSLELNVGFSHPISLDIPEGLDVSVEKNTITVKGVNNELVGQFAATVRAQKVPEPYKGKGIRYENEVVRRKEGKKAI